MSDDKIRALRDLEEKAAQLRAELPQETYVIQEKDYAARIAQKCGYGPLRVIDLVKANPQIKDWRKVGPGQVINLPRGWSVEAGK